MAARNNNALKFTTADSRMGWERRALFSRSVKTTCALAWRREGTLKDPDTAKLILNSEGQWNTGMASMKMFSSHFLAPYIEETAPPLLSRLLLELDQICLLSTRIFFFLPALPSVCLFVFLFCLFCLILALLFCTAPQKAATLPFIALVITFPPQSSYVILAYGRW